MNESAYYPAGAYDDPSAPYNEVERPERDFDCHVEVILEKDEVITTNDYIPEYGTEIGYGDIDTSETDWDGAYENNCITIPEMLRELKVYVEQDLAMSGKNSRKGKRLQRLLDACSGWVVKETYIEEL